MDKKQNDLSPEIEERWREWSQTEPAIDGQQLRRNLLNRIPDRRPRPRVRLALVAAAASLLAVLIGLETTRSPIPMIAEEQAVVYESTDNVILVLQEGGDPIYVLVDRAENTDGGGR